MPDALIHLAKVVGIVTTTGLGVLGLLTEYRDDSKQITKWGRRALIAILVSGTLTILVHVLEAVREAKSQARKLNRLTAEVARQEETLASLRVGVVDHRGLEVGGGQEAAGLPRGEWLWARRPDRESRASGVRPCQGRRRRW